MTVVFDAVATFQSSSVGATSGTLTSMTVGSGSNRFLVAGAIFFTAISGLTAVWDAVGANQAMTLIGSVTSGTVTTYLFGLANPVSGNKNVTFSWTTSNANRGFFAHSWNGVNQSTPTYNFNTSTGTGTALSVTVTSVLTGDVVIGNLCIAAGLGVLSSVSDTQLYLAGSFGAGGNWANGAGANYTLTAVRSVSGAWEALGVAIGQVAAAAPVQRSPFANQTPMVMLCPNFAKSIERATSRSIIGTVRGCGGHARLAHISSLR